MDKIRVRFGIRLGWPFANAGVFVVYMSRDYWSKLFDAVATVRGLLSASGNVEIADRIVCERS